jgi:hypothetical protein
MTISMTRWARIRLCLEIVLTIAGLIVGAVAGYVNLSQHP